MNDQEIWRRFERARTMLWVSDGLLIAGGIVLYFFSKAAVFMVGLLVLGLLLVAAGIATVVTSWRCPACRHMLPLRNSSRLRHCPHCGVNLDE